MKPEARSSLYEPFDFALVRAPLLPFETYLGLSEHGTTLPSDVDQLVQRALLVGAGELASELRRQSHPPRDSARKKLLRYLIRMSTRPTPFGLFAGVGLAHWSTFTDLALTTPSGKRRTRPDMHWLLRLVVMLESQLEIRRGLTLVAHPCAVIRGGRVFLTERIPRGEHGASPSVSLRATGMVTRALGMAREPIAYAELMRELGEAAPGVEPDRVEGLLTELWQHTLLITDLWPPLTSSDPGEYVVNRLEDIAAAQPIRTQLIALREAMATWDATPPDEALDAFRQLLDDAASVVADSASSPVMVDMALDLGGNAIHVDVANELATAAELLLRLSPAPGGPPYLAGYRQVFEARYGHQREVPLLEVLDPIVGLGNPWAYGGGAGISSEKASQRARILLDLAIGAVRDRRRVVELDSSLQAQLETWAPAPLTAPASIDLYAFVAADSRERLDRGFFQVVVGPNLGTDAAGRNLGRFADLLGPDATCAVQQIADAEQNGRTDQVWAELVYLPRSFHAANVVIRPTARKYELVLGVTPGVARSHTIPLNELAVGTRAGRLYVRWPAHDVEVIACAGHMLNNLNAPAAVRFLAEVGRDGVTQLSSFDWGPAASFPFLPRVQVGRIVLRPAEWRVDARSRSTQLATDSPSAFRATVDRWRERWDVPRHVALSTGDNRLLLDLEDELQLDELRTEVRNLGPNNALALQEVLPDLGAVWLPGPAGHYALELVVSLKLRAPGSPEPARDTTTSARTPQSGPEPTRMRPPGTEWLYVKLYCSPMFEDDVLAGPVFELANQAVVSGEADEWFFVRYADPDPNIRLRFRGAPEALVNRLLPRICTWAAGLMHTGYCARFSFDTYDRELERYGGDAGLRAAESLFAADSRAVCRLLQLVLARRLPLDRSTLAVLTIDDLLAGLGLDPAGRLAWYREGVTTRVAAGDEYRRRKTQLRALIGEPLPVDGDSAMHEVARILADRRADMATAAASLWRLADLGELAQQMATLHHSYIHLHCNRLLGADSAAERIALGLILRTREGLDRAPLLRSIGRG